MKIFLAAGHGGNDPGAVQNDTTESKETEQIIEKTFEILKANLPPGHFLVKVPHHLELISGVSYINNTPGVNSNDIAIEVHMNSNKGTVGFGIETYYGAKELAERLQKTLVKETGLKDRGVKLGNYLYFNDKTIPGSALVELGFINNLSDLTIVREKGPKALAKAIADYIGVTLPDPGVGKITKIEITGENLEIKSS